MKLGLAGAVLLGTFGLAQSTQAGIFTMNQAAFTAGNPGLTTLDFEGICVSGTCNAPAFPGVAFSGPNVVVADGPTYGAPSDWLADNTYGGFINMSFAPSISAIGFNVATNFTGSVAGSVTISLFNGATLLDTQTFATAGLSTFTTFAGWSGFGGLDNVSVTLTATEDFVNIDNLSFGTPVPEPSTLILLGAGLLAGGRRLRSRRQ